MLNTEEGQLETLQEEVKILRTEQTNRQLEQDRNQQVDIHHIPTFSQSSIVPFVFIKEL